MSLIDIPHKEYSKIKVYIAGPMRGRKNLNHEAFDRAEKRLIRKMVWDPVNPAEMDRIYGIDPSKDMTKEEVKEALKRDVEALFEVHSIYMLKGWEESLGARMEHALAVALGLSIFYE
mgnify:CR=1 FL=1